MNHFEVHRKASNSLVHCLSFILHCFRVSDGLRTKPAPRARNGKMGGLSFFSCRSLRGPKCVVYSRIELPSNQRRTTASSAG